MHSITFYFAVSGGNLSATGTLTTDANGGTLAITPDATGVITVTANNNYTLFLDGTQLLGGIVHYGAYLTTISWTFPTAPNPLYPHTLNVRPFWQYLFSGDLFGFFRAIYVQAFTLPDILYAVLCLLILAPLYIKTKSLLLVCIIWILLGGFFMTLMKAASPIAVLFEILAVAGVLWKLVRSN